MNRTKLHVGSDWNRCPCCHSSYLIPEPHHSACPLHMSDAFCHYCGALYGKAHDLGCPHTTGLYPVLQNEVSARLECANCNTVFILGDCYAPGKTAMLCVGCAWEESAGLEPDAR